MIKAIIFDMDGVIVDTEHFHCTCYMEILKKYNIIITKDFYYNYWTKKGKDIKDFVKDMNININSKIIREEKRKIYHNKLKNELKTYNGVVEKIKELSKIYPLALVTNSYKKDADLILELTKLSRFFKFVITKNDINKAKPDPEGFNIASNKLNIKPENIIVVEDAEKGLIAAKKAGMKCITIPNKYTKDNDFSSSDFILKNIKELKTSLINQL